MDWTILGVLPEADRRGVLKAAVRRRYKRREVLFHEGDPGETLHLIEKGHVLVRVTNPLGDVVTVDVLGPGDVVGELALIDGGYRSATVVSLDPTETLALSRDVFEGLRHAHPSVERLLSEALALSVKRLTDLLADALYVSADTRVVRRLMATAETFGGTKAGVVLPLTQEELGSLAGTSRATANRVLGELEDAGAVAVARGKITILDPQVLHRRKR